VMEWNAKITTNERIFGSILDNLLAKTGQMVLVARLVQPVNTLKAIRVAVPPRAEYEPGFSCWITLLHTLAKQTSAPLIFYAKEITSQRIDKVFREMNTSQEVSHVVWDDWNNLISLKPDLEQDDVLVAISARQGSISYHSYLSRLPKQLSRHFRVHNFVVIYPEQHGIRVNPESQVRAMPVA